MGKDGDRNPTGGRRASGAAGPVRVVIVGGGFAGVYATRHLETQFRQDKSVQLTLVSRQNYFLMTPLLFEAGSGVLEPRHAVNPIRPLLDRARFVQAEVRDIDLDRRVIQASPAAGEVYDIPYDHLVLTLGGVANTRLVPGTEHARGFKTLADAIALRNHVIQIFERADVEPDPVRRKALLTFVIVGGGLVGTELVGELTEFVEAVCDTYPHVSQDEIRFELIESAPFLVPELEQELGAYAQRVLERRGVRVRVNTKVASIEADRVWLPDGEVIVGETIVASLGVVPSPLVAGLQLDKDKKGRVQVDATLRSTSRPEVWALGDCANIPDPQGKPYPPLAQHALREAKVVAGNVAAIIRGSGDLKPFVYSNKGTLAALGHFKGVGRVFKFKIYGFAAWWVWRSYYLMQMPQWSRRLRIVIDWTIALMFKNDVVQLDLAPADEASPPPDAGVPSTGPRRGARAGEGLIGSGRDGGDDTNEAVPGSGGGPRGWVASRDGGREPGLPGRPREPRPSPEQLVLDRESVAV